MLSSHERSHFLPFLKLGWICLIFMLEETVKENGLELFWLHSDKLFDL